MDRQSCFIYLILQVYGAGLLFFFRFLFPLQGNWCYNLYIFAVAGPQ